MSNSKALSNDDSSGFEFAKEMLNGDDTAAINFDRLQFHKVTKKYLIFEYLLCEESQPNVTPHSSHPKYYWYKNKRKFISLFEVADKLDAVLYLVNYAKKGTRHENEIKVMKVKSCNEKGIVTDDIKLTRTDFQQLFRKLNKESI